MKAEVIMSRKGPSVVEVAHLQRILISSVLMVVHGWSLKL
jgi:hypothetical protein